MSEQRDYRIFEARPLPWREAVANLTDLAMDYERRGEWGMAGIALHEAVDVATEGGADGADLVPIAEAVEALHEREDAAKGATDAAH